MSDHEPEPWVGVERVAEHLDMTPGQLYQMRHRGIGPPAVKVGKRLKYRLSEVDSWAESQREVATA